MSRLLLMRSVLVLGCARDITPAVNAYRAAAPCDTYFPSGTVWNEREGTGPFKLLWFSTPLKALGEPCLHDYSLEAGDIYRFLFLPAFHPSVVATIYLLDGQCFAWGNTVDFRLGYVGEKQQFKLEGVGAEVGLLLSGGQCDAFVALVTASQFWQLLSADPELSGYDGARLVIEGRRPSSYHVAERWSPADEFRAPFDFLARQLSLGESYLDKYGQ